MSCPWTPISRFLSPSSQCRLTISPPPGAALPDSIRRRTHFRHVWTVVSLYLKNRPIMFPARLDAMPPPRKAEPAKVDAWLNLSQREKATVLVMVRTRAMTGGRVSLEQGGGGGGNSYRW
jgi:hypothetical protein